MRRPDGFAAVPDGEVPEGALATAVDLMEVAVALSDALDLVGVEDVRHGKRVAFIAERTGQALGLSPDEDDDLFLAALLHDCGVSSTVVHRQLTDQLDWEGSDEHCLHGFELLRSFPPFRRIAEVVRRHHTAWTACGSAPPDRPAELLANVVFLSDRVDVLAQQHGKGDILLAREGIRETVRAQSGERFSPEVVAAFLEASDTEAFWLMLEPHHLDRYIVEASRVPCRRPATLETLRELALVFARIVDEKSPYTARHSVGVARISRKLGERSGLDPETCAQLEIAGLLHDLGKLRVPDAILEKPDSLSESEAAFVTRHSFETYQILRGVKAFRTLAFWAATHHEGVSGQGYPFHVSGADVPFPARILAVADVFQALSEDRPYRAALTPEEVVGVLKEMAEAGRLDPDVVALVEGNLEETWGSAIGPAEA